MNFLKTIFALSKLFFIFYFLLSCKGGGDISVISEDPFIREIKDSTSELNVELGVFKNISPELVPIRIMPIPDSDFLVVLDYVTKSVVLVDKTGMEYSKVGGPGRGPGEFKGMGRIHIGADGLLYVMDSYFRRYNIFEIDVENTELRYHTTIVPKPDLNFRLQEAYVTESGRFGVFNQITDYQTGENSYYLYTIDETFSPIERLLEMPGNDKLKLSQVFFINNSVGQSTYWDLDGEWFYYINSHSSVIKKYHLKTGKFKTIQYFEFGDRKNSSYNITSLNEILERLIETNPPVGEAIENSKTLPLFGGFIVQDNRILFEMYYAGGENNIFLLIDQSSEKVSFMEVPPFFRRYAMQGHVIYGLGNTGLHDRQIKFLNIYQ
ncbi:MAG: 6-bladed beta-propeller [Balneolaceae bacterium]|nr:MAG: 6-bladed beta-propeller [Balneolaceae bacterium]